MMPMARIEHRLSGRTRFRVPIRRRDGPYFDRVTSELAGLEGVEGVRATAATGSVLVYHLVPLERVVAFARERELFEVREPEPGPAAVRQPKPLPEAVGERLDELDLGIRLASEGRSSLAAITLGGLVLLAAYQVVSGRALPAGVTLLNYAAGLVDRPSRRG